VRCSSCESLLDGYVTGSLTARRTADVTAHLRACAVCAALVEELKVIDALLATTKSPDLPANFTFAVMAHARSMPLPHARRFSMWMAGSFYVVAAWVAFAGWMFASGADSRAVFARAFASVTSALHPVATAIAGSSHAFGPNAVVFGATFSLVLSLDALALAGVVYFYRSVRPRLVAAVATEIA
jgi:anti-sigma factor RsiW